MFENTKLALESLGLSSNESDEQLAKLQQTITTAVGIELAKLKPEQAQQFAANPQSINNQFTQEEIEMVSSEVGMKIFKGYFDEITKRLEPGQKEKFYAMMSKDFMTS